MDESTKAILTAQAVTLFGLLAFIIRDWHTKRQLRLDREEDRKDRAQLAEFTAEQLEIVKQKGDERVKKIVEELVKTRNVAIMSAKESRVALKEANGVNSKIEKLGQRLAEEKDERVSGSTELE